ncbi:g5088 [Coccomyxa elongata]
MHESDIALSDVSLVFQLQRSRRQLPTEGLPAVNSFFGRSSSKWYTTPNIFRSSAYSSFSSLVEQIADMLAAAPKAAMANDPAAATSSAGVSGPVVAATQTTPDSIVAAAQITKSAIAAAPAPDSASVVALGLDGPSAAPQAPDITTATAAPSPTQGKPAINHAPMGL